MIDSLSIFRKYEENNNNFLIYGSYFLRFKYVKEFLINFI